MEKLDLGIEIFRVITDGRIEDDIMDDPFYHGFFTNQIVTEGLQDFHLTIVSGCTDDEKKQILDDTIASWDVKGEPITKL